MDLHRIGALLDRLPRLQIAVAGDFCLDVYWQLDPRPRARSAETDRPVWSVAAERRAPGGAGNAAANLAALGVGGVAAFGVLGPDPYGLELRRLLEDRSIETTFLIEQPEAWSTPAYVKPYLEAVEQERYDLGASQSPSTGSAARLAAALEAACMDALLLNQQIAPGLLGPELALAVERIASRIPVLADCRAFDHRLGPVFYKAALHDLPGGLPQARRLQAATGRPLFLTQGAEGLLVLDSTGARSIPAPRLVGPLDPVGAGDTAAAALTAALAAGADPSAAAELAALAAAVTVTKLRQTGTATPEEILALLARREGERP